MDESRALLDTIDLRTKPAGSCQQQQELLPSPALVALLVPNMRGMLCEDAKRNVESAVERIQST